MAETSTKLGRVSLVPRGAYDAAAVYNRLDIVAYEGSSYLVLADGTTGVPPKPGPDYMLVAEKGDKGDTGAKGDKGNTGDTGPKGDTGEQGPQGIQGLQGDTGLQGVQGETGASGVGIQSIKRTGGDGSPGTTDTYTITMTDGSTAVFTVYNGADGTSFTVLGRYDTLDELTSEHPSGSKGDAWAVGSAEDNDIYLWNVTTQAWDNIGALQGPPGPSGPAAGFGEISAEVDGGISSGTNPPGVVVTASGPDTAKNLHFSFQNLRGQTGPAGADGADGKSAYQQAVDGGYTGTEEEFKAILATGPWLPLTGGNVSGTLTCTDVYALSKTFSIESFVNDPAIISILGSGNWKGTSVTPKIKFLAPGSMRTESYSRPTILRDVADPIKSEDAANKKYVDDQVGDIASILDSINGEVV